MPGSEPILQARNRDSRFAEGKPFSVLNGVTQDISPTTIVEPTVPPENGASNRERTCAVNRIVEFEGDLYWFHRNVIRTHAPESGWMIQPTTRGSRGLVTGMNDTQYEEKVLGLFPFLTTDGQQKLAAVYVDSSFNSRLGIHVKNSKLTGDGLWSSETTLSVGNTIVANTADGDGVFGYPILDGNKLYIQFQGGDNTRLFVGGYVEIDLENLSATTFSRTPESQLPSNITSTSGNNVHAIPPSVFCTYSGINWLMYCAGGAGQSLGTQRPSHQPQAIVVERARQLTPQLDLILQTGIRPTENTGFPGGTTDYFEGRNELFVASPTGQDTEYMYALGFIWGSGAGGQWHTGWACWKLLYDSDTDSLLNLGDIGWKVLPPPLRLSTTSTLDVRSRFKAYSLVDVSGQLTNILDFSLDGDEGSLTNVYEWRGEDEEMRLLNTGGDASWSKPLIKIGGGEQVWSPRQPYNFAFRVDASGASPGKLKLRTRVFGEGESIKVRYYFTSSKGPMKQLASISAPTSGSISANELTGVTANSGEFIVDWDIQAQGFDLNDVFNIHPVAEDN